MTRWMLRFRPARQQDCPQTASRQVLDADGAIQGAKSTLEIGTLGGYSTIWLVRGLPAEGHLILLEFRGIRRFNEMIAAEPRLNATAIQTVGIKGYDGFLIAVVH